MDCHYIAIFGSEATRAQLMPMWGVPVVFLPQEGQEFCGLSWTLSSLYLKRKLWPEGEHSAEFCGWSVLGNPEPEGILGALEFVASCHRCKWLGKSLACAWCLRWGQTWRGLSSSLQALRIVWSAPSRRQAISGLYLLYSIFQLMIMSVVSTLWLLHVVNMVPWTLHTCLCWTYCIFSRCGVLDLW